MEKVKASKEQEVEIDKRKNKENQSTMKQHQNMITQILAIAQNAQTAQSAQIADNSVVVG